MKMTAMTSGGKITRIGARTNRKTTHSRIRIPMTDHARSPHRAARATKGFEKNGSRSEVI